MATVRVENAAKNYGQTKVLSNINIDVQEGEFIVIVGPSGCGKSSLLRMIAGLEAVTSGDIYINDQRVNEVEPKDRNIAMVFQNYALYPHMSVFKNMAYSLKLKGMSKDDITKRVNETASLLQLENLLHRRPSELSGGQRQRVAMGRAIVREPAVFLFDEPLSNLDAKLRTEMRMEIKALQQRLKVTSLYVTHDQVEAMTLADRLVILDQGQIEQIDTPQRVYENPATLHVASFIGTPQINLLEATVFTSEASLEFSGSQRVALSTLIPEADLSASLLNPSVKSINVILGIRPENISLCDAADANLACQVKSVEILGAESILHCALNETAEAVRVKTAGMTNIKAGDQLFARAGSCHLFDPDTGKRIT